MSLSCKRLIVLLSIAAAWGADKDKGRFAPGPASSYANRQSSEGVTIAAAPLETDEQTEPAFGKLNPYKYGVLPVLVVIQNDRKTSLDLSRMQVEYVLPGGGHIEATPAADVPYITGPERPKVQTLPLPRRKKKNPLSSVVIESRAFAARMLPPGESAHGFFYFQTGHRSASRLYVTSILEAGSGKELFYYEIPLSGR